MNEKFVLCRPQGGINDSLTQIEACWRYADISRRTLVVDTAKSGGFGLPFGRFFREAAEKERHILYPSPLLFQSLQHLRTLPACVRGRLHDYSPVYDQEIRNFVDSETGEKLSFEFRRRHDAELLVHDQCGGNVNALRCLTRIRFTHEFRRDVLQRLKPLLGRPYHATVIRNNQDYSTDYRSAFDQLYDTVANRPLLVCSDSAEVIEYARSFFDRSELITLHDTVEVPGATEKIPYAELILQLDEASRYKLVVKAFSDLIGLAGSTALHITRLVSGGIYGGYSGFVVLARNLHRNRGIVRKLINP